MTERHTTKLTDWEEITPGICRCTVSAKRDYELLQERQIDDAITSSAYMVEHWSDVQGHVYYQRTLLCENKPLKVCVTTINDNEDAMQKKEHENAEHKYN